MFTKADLHIHSAASDGALTPRQIIILAKNRGIDTIAIADHNSVAAIDEASESGKLYGISVIPAVELSTRHNGESIHLLGYFRDRSYKLNAFEQILRLVKIHNVTEVRKVLGGFRRKQNLNSYLSTSEGIHLLRTFGASVVLAHPVRISAENLSEVLDMPFDGLEAKYCRNGQYETSFFIKTALNRFAFYTAGSDFHTDRINDNKHCLIGEPHLNSLEIQRFLKYSRALVLGSEFENEIINRGVFYY